MSMVLQSYLGRTASLSDQVTLLKRVASLDVSPELTGYTKVIIYCGQSESGDQIVYESGDDTGETLEIRNVFGSQEMADNILASIRGFQYQPYNAGSALLDPAVEMGDGVTIHGMYSGIYSRTANFGPLHLADISAPQEDEIEHEFALESTTDREFTRFTAQVRAMLKVQADAIVAEVNARTEADEELESQLSIQADQISAKVSKTGGSSSSFGWTLTDSAWTIYADSTEVLRATSDGLTIHGRIEADEGWIGGENGFRIDANKIYKNISQYGGSQSTGVYIGTDGIQLGQGFKVDSGGNLTATRGTFGSLTTSGGQTGGSYHGSLGGCGGSVSTGIKVGNTQIGTYVENLVASKITADYISGKIAQISTVRVQKLTANKIECPDVYITSSKRKLSTTYITDGNGVAQKVVTWS